MAEFCNAQMTTVVRQLSTKEDISLVDILSLAEASIDNLRTVLDSIDSKIYREFREIAEYIAQTKSEIGQLSANDISSSRFPEAGLELQAVVESTEHATNRIMECAETIMTADPSNPGHYHNIVNENVLSIFEACSFQDITGQRISKVVETLEQIEKRVNKFAEVIGAEAIGGPQPFDEVEAAREKRKKDQILNGPQMNGQGVSQDDIDNLFD